MDTVLVFNTELSGLYGTRPPISKAKMAAITKSAMKAIKFYKHVVQSVEKFILKCKPEYKVPGLYVIDSIVRQSRHQFGADKDVFAPRFARNMQSTFVNLFRCTPEDKSRIIRVLNLWQKNNVFAPEVIQPLFDLANPNHPLHQTVAMNIAASGSGTQEASSSNGAMLNMSGGQESPPASMQDDGHTMSSDMSGPTSAPSTGQLDSSTMRQLQQLQQLLLRQTAAEAAAAGSAASSATGPVPHPDAASHFGSKNFDYGGHHHHQHHHSQHHVMDSDGHASASVGHGDSDNASISKLLNDPTVLRQLQTLQKLQQQEDKQSKLNEIRAQDEAFEKHLATVLKQQKLPFANECDLSRQGPSSAAEQSQQQQQQMFGIQSSGQHNTLLQHQQQQIHQQILAQHQQQVSASNDMDPEVELVSDDGKVEVINLDGNSRSPSPADRDRYKRRRSRSRSPRRRRRSRSRSRSPRSRRRGGSRERSGKDKDKDREREKEREHDRERRRKGLPDLKKEHLSVCSTTLWVGHLSKLVHQEELSDTFGKYGDIVSIDMIHPRGCAFIVMNRRQDAYKAMSGLKNHKMQGRAITISWAAGKGVKSKEWKDYWDLDLGVSYVPYSKISPATDFESLEEGGMFDEESMPAWLRNKNNPGVTTTTDPVPPPLGVIFPTADTTQPPPVTGGPPPPLMPPIVNPFSLGNVQRLINPLGMHMPPNIVPGIPMGVPPPQMMMSMPPMPIDKSIPPPTGTAPPNFMNFPPMPGTIPPHMPPIIPPAPMVISGPTPNDDHMDLEMEDETSSTNNKAPPPAMLGMFNRPPPQVFGPASGAPPPPFGNARERDSSRDRHRDRSNSRERRGNSRDRDFRGDRDSRGRDDRRNNNDFGNRNDRGGNDRGGNDRGGISRWGGEHRSGSRDLDQPPRGRRSDSRDRNSRDRNEKPLHDRLRDMAGDGNGMGPVDGPPQPWRDVPGPPGPPMGQGNFNPNMNFMDQGPRGMRPMHMMQMSGGPPGMGGGPPGMGGGPPGMGGGPPGMGSGPPGMGPNFRGGNDFDFNNRCNDFDRRGPPPRDMFGGGVNMNNPFGPGPRGGGPMGGRGSGPFMPRGGPGGPMFMRGPRPGPHGGPLGPAGFNDRPFFDGPPDRGFDNNNHGNNDGRGNRMSRGPDGDRDRRGRAPWNERGGMDDRLNEPAQDKNDEHDVSKRTSSRWAANDCSPTVVSEEEDWDDEETINEVKKNLQKTEKLAPLPQTEPIDDDSQEDDFNDFEENEPTVNDAANKDIVPIVEIPDESSSPVEFVPTSEANSNHSVPENTCEDSTPLYDEPQNKDSQDNEQRNTDSSAEFGEKEVIQEDDNARCNENDGNQVYDEHKASENESRSNLDVENRRQDDEMDYQGEHENQDEDSEDHTEPQNHNVQQDHIVYDNLDECTSEENLQNGDERSEEDQTSRYDDENDDEQERRCPTPDEHVESEQECNAGQDVDVARQSNDEEENVATNSD